MNEETRYGQANKIWKEMTPLLWKITYVGLGMMFGGVLLGNGVKPKVISDLCVCSFFAGSVGLIGGMLSMTHYGFSTGFKEVVEARLNRLNAKILPIEERISSLDSCFKNVEELEQLNLALTYFDQKRTQWEGHIITDGRLPISSTLKVTFKNRGQA